MINKATHTISHEEEPDYTTHPDSLPIMPADTMGIFIFLEDGYQERKNVLYHLFPLSPQCLVRLPTFVVVLQMESGICCNKMHVLTVRIRCRVLMLLSKSGKHVLISCRP
jgi:hypothetical protein